MNTTVINLEELSELIARGTSVRVAEILPPKYFQAGHLPGAINLPLEGFDSAARAALPDKDALTVVYCASSTCPNSDIAARKLEELGYTQIRVFRDGKAAWADAGLTLVKEAA